jgi:ferrochelatase
MKVHYASNWGQRDALVTAFASRVARALSPEGDRTLLVFSAHSLPVAVLRAGDPYEREVLASAERIAGALGERVSTTPPRRIVFQSQGMGTGPGGKPIEWLGPDLGAELVRAKDEGFQRVVCCPVGFLADHVEILYDLDIEARAQASDLGLTFSRTDSLNDDDDFIDTLCGLARELVS